MIHTQEEAKKLFREAFQNSNSKFDAVAIVKCVAAKQHALTAGVSIRELQAIEDDVQSKEPNA